MSTIKKFYNLYPSLIVEQQQDIYNLGPTDFERLCQGWSMETFQNAKVTRGPTNQSDQGVDIEVVVSGMTPMRIVVQAKCWLPSGPNVSIKVVNETAGAAVARHAGYAIVITSAGFTKDAKLQAQRSSNEGNIKMTLLDGTSFWNSLLQLPEYRKRLDTKLQLKSAQSVIPEVEMTQTPTPIFTNHDHFVFGSKIEQKIKSDQKLHNWLVKNGISCFQDFLFLSEQKYTQLKQFAIKLSTGSKLALNSFLDSEIHTLRQMFKVRLNDIMRQVKSAQTLESVFKLLGWDPKVCALFVSSDGVGQNFDEKDHPRVLCAIANQDFEKLMLNIHSETCRHELVAVMNVITGKSQEELEGSLLNVSVNDNIFSKFQTVNQSHGKIKKVMLGPGLFSLSDPLVIASNVDIIGSGCGITVVCGCFVMETSHCKLKNFTFSKIDAMENNLVVSIGCSSIITTNIEFGYRREPGDGKSPKKSKIPASSQHHQQPLQSPASSQSEQPLQSHSKSPVSSQQLIAQQVQTTMLSAPISSKQHLPTENTLVTGKKRNASQSGQFNLHEGDTVSFDFKLFASDLTTEQQGKIVCVSTEKMNQIGWIKDESKQLDEKYASNWFPNCDLSETIVPGSGEEDDEKEKGFTVGVTESSTIQAEYTPVPNHQVLEKYKIISVAYGYIMQQNEQIEETVPIQENGMVIDTDLNKECAQWCKICFVQKQETWYLWKLAKNVKIQIKKNH